MMGSGFKPADVAAKYGGNAKWYEDERPQHSVSLTKPFYIQTTEVTQRQWENIMGDNPSEFKTCGKDCPVEKISWHDAKEFIKKLNEKEKTNKFRLPTEAEWEYACRAGSTTAFYFGNQKKLLVKNAWNTTNSREWTHKVNRKKPNAWGLYDMHGNVLEWCEDWYGDYPSDSVTDPTGPSSGTQKISRGGSWRSATRFCRSSYRHGVDPGFKRANRGFRIAMDP